MLFLNISFFLGADKILKNEGNFEREANNIVFQSQPSETDWFSGKIINYSVFLDFEGYSSTIINVFQAEMIYWRYSRVITIRNNIILQIPI